MSAAARTKVAFLARGLTTGGGVTRFIRTSLQVIDRVNPPTVDLVVVTDQERLSFDNLNVVRLTGPDAVASDDFTLAVWLLKERFDVVVYPKTLIPFAHFFFPFRKVIIAYDLVYYDPTISEFSWKDSLHFKIAFPLSLRVASRCLVTSESTRRDIEHWFRWFRRPMPLFSGAVDHRFRRDPAAQPADVTPGVPYFFYCGSLSPRKNVLRALQAFDRIKDRIPHRFYICTGVSWNDAPVTSYIRDHLPDRVSLLGYGRTDKLVALYSRADAFVFPSLYEGFGLPILEAQACGCPVLTSDRTSCPEVAGAGAVIVDAESVSSIADGLLALALDGSLRDALREQGYENVKRYSWQRSVDKLLAAVSSG
jgi:glycosyltransferase involved in cell wall biosynthesis